MDFSFRASVFHKYLTFLSFGLLIELKSAYLLKGNTLKGDAMHHATVAVIVVHGVVPGGPVVP